MDKKDVEKQVISFAAQVYGVDPASINRETRIIEDLGRSSLKLISLVSLVNDEYDILVSNRDALGLATIGDLVDRAAEEALA